MKYFIRNAAIALVVIWTVYMAASAIIETSRDHIIALGRSRILSAITQGFSPFSITPESIREELILKALMYWALGVAIPGLVLIFVRPRKPRQS